MSVMPEITPEIAARLEMESVAIDEERRVKRKPDALVQAQELFKQACGTPFKQHERRDLTLCIGKMLEYLESERGKR